jgi:hypothetical protein
MMLPSVVVQRRRPSLLLGVAPRRNGLTVEALRYLILYARILADALLRVTKTCTVKDTERSKRANAKGDKATKLSGTRRVRRTLGKEGG